MRRLSGKLTYANVVSTLCLIIAIGGASAFAASQLGKNTVGPKQLKKNAVTTAKVRKEAITAAKVKKGTLTGAQINLSTLGTVPSATNAQHAQTADAIQAPEALRLIGEPEAPFSPGWENFGMSHAGFYMDREGVVHFEGEVVGVGSSQHVFDLPPAYRPANPGAFPAAGAGDTYARVSVNGSGEVSSSSKFFVNLNGITFRAES
jgi:hypothetical protein